MSTPEPPAPTERRFRCTACGGEFDEMEVTCPAGQYHCGPCVPVIEPPAPTPSATTCHHDVVIDLNRSSEPEGIRRDRQCRDCGATFMVTKGGMFPLRVPPASAPAATAEPEPIRDELSHLTERLMNWLSLAAPESYASRAEAFAWAARAHDLARQRTATSTSTEAT